MCVLCRINGYNSSPLLHDGVSLIVSGYGLATYAAAGGRHGAKGGDTSAAATVAAAAPAGWTTVSATGNREIDGLLSGYKWSGPITYSFPDSKSDYADYTSNEPNSSGFAQVSLAEQVAVTTALNFAAGYTNLSITYAGTDVADLRIAQSSAANPTAYSYYPDDGAGGDAWFGTSYNYRNPLLGDYYYFTHIHELGHSLGLKHAHERGGPANVAVPSAHDALEYTVMSYRSYPGGSTSGGYTNEDYGYPTTYMMNDILALQTMYGADYTTQSGNTVYSWSPTTGEWFIDGVGQGRPGGDNAPASANRVFMTIWDGGGNDTYDLSNYTASVSINLNPGASSITSSVQLAYLGNGHYAQGTVYNAYLFNSDARSYIENAIGGSAGDTIVGNPVANRLDGRAGNDTLTGNAGADTFVFKQGYGQDIVTDFKIADGDMIDLSAFGGIGALASLNISQVGANVVIDFGGGDKLTLNNVAATALTEDSFVFGGPPPAPTGEAPSAITLSGASILESASVGTAIGTLGAVDADSGQTYVYTLLNNAGGRFAIVGNTLVLAAAVSFESAAAYGIRIRVTDSGNQVTEQDFTIAVSNVAPSAPVDSNSGANTVVEKAANGTVVGITASAADPNGGAVTYSLTNDAGGRFAINTATGVVTVANGALLNAGSSYQIAVAASDGNLATTSVFTIAVTALIGVTLNGNSSANTLTGTQANDTINGNGGNDTLYGLGGNDTLDGGAGSDKMYGGPGNDTYVVNATGDSVIENANEGTDTVRSSVTYTLPANVENLTLTGSSALNGTGNALDNVITGNSGNNTLAGLAGADTLIGGSGTDTATYAASNAAVNVSLATGLGAGGHAQGDTLSGIENLIGSSYNDTLEGNAGTNNLNGGAGTDTVTYEHASAAVKVSLAVTSAQATGGAGTDTLSGFENLTGSNFNDTLTGSSGNNVIYGLAGNDTINGGNGADRLIGGLGNDSLNGGAGNDAFVFMAPNEGLDTISGFSRNADWIEISALGFGGGLVAGVAPQVILGANVLSAVGVGSSGYFFLDNSGTDSGKLYWDPTGGSGGDAVAIAQLTGITTLSPSDFHIV